MLKKVMRCFKYLLLFPLLTLVACTVAGPTYQPPQSEVPSQWSATATLASPAAPLTTGAWWTLFRDPLLDSLISRATAANYSLQKAEARIREARAQRIIAAANGNIGSSAAATSSRRSDNSSSSGGKQDLFQIGFDAGWELDLFGKMQRSTESADALLAASHEDMRDVLVSLQAEVARNYLDLRGTQRRLAIVNKIIGRQEQAVDFVVGRLAFGLATELEQAQAVTQLALYRAEVPPLENSIRMAAIQLALLIGQPPANLLTELTEKTTTPAILPELPNNLPSDLLRQRPDIRGAERRLAAATAEIGVATADLFPRFSLTGLFGMQSTSLGDLITAGSRYWSIGPTMKYAIFDRGRIRAGIEVRNAQRDAALATYEQTVLAALGEAEKALTAFTNEQDLQIFLQQAVTSGEKELTLAKGLFAAGLTDTLAVIVSERTLYFAEDKLWQSKQRLTLSLVALFKALGGGWNNLNNPEPEYSPPPNALSDTDKSLPNTSHSS